MSNLDNDPLLEAIPVVDGYKFLAPCFLYGRIGAGGMGTVYRGRHTNLDIDVAVKCLNPSLALQDRKFVTRFQREAKLAASIDQENLIRVFDVGSQNDLHYIVMEYVRGETARERVVRKGALSESEALAIVLGAASALAAAHARGVVHRDIKPDNIMISVDGRVKVADLGLAKPLVGESTLTHGIMGTPKYMAPEQWIDPDLVGPWTDVWALGATFFFLVAGHDPFRGASAGQPFPLVHNPRPDLSQGAVDLLARCVARDHEQRFAHAGLVLQQLRALRGHDVGDALADPDAARTTTPQTLVSPPPYRPTPTRTLVRIEREPPVRPASVATREVPAPPAVELPTPRAARGRRGWLVLGFVLLAGVVWLLVDGPRRTAATVAACEDALAHGDLDLAVRLGERLTAAEAAGLRAELASRLIARAEQSRQARQLRSALLDFRRARELVPGPAVETACTMLEETLRTALLAGTTLSLANGSVVGKRTRLEVRGPPDLARCTVQGVTHDLSAGSGVIVITCEADGPFRVEVQLEHAADVRAPLSLELVGDVSAPVPTVEQPSAGAVSRSPVVLQGKCSDANAVVWVGDRKVEVEHARWTLSLELAEGSHELVVVAEDAVGNRSDAVPWSVVVDDTPPALDLDEAPAASEDDGVDVAGTTESDAALSVAGEIVRVGPDGRFRARVSLPELGRNEVVVLARDPAGNVTRRRWSIERVPSPAAITVLEPTAEHAEWSPVTLVKGRVRSGVRELTIDGIDVPFDAAGDFAYAGQFEPGPLELVAIDADATPQRATVELRLPRDLHLAVDPLPASSDPAVRVRGRAEPAALVRVGDSARMVAADGSFEVPAVLPGVGVHELIVSAWRSGAPRQLGVVLPRTFGAAARVEAVQPDTAAAAVDLRPGDLIEAIGGRAVDAQQLLTLVAGSTAPLALHVLRGGERHEIAVTPWPAPAAIVRARAEVLTAPGSEAIVPVFGIEPGVTTRTEVERMGAPMDRDRLIFEVQGHVVYCDERVVERVVLAGGALPANWVRAGLGWGTDQQAALAWIERRWRCREEYPAAEGREGVLVFDVRPGLRVTLIFPRGKLTRAEIKFVR